MPAPRIDPHANPRAIQLLNNELEQLRSLLRVEKDASMDLGLDIMVQFQIEYLIHTMECPSC